MAWLLAGGWPERRKVAERLLKVSAERLLKKRRDRVRSENRQGTEILKPPPEKSALLSGERGHSAFSSANQSEVRVTSRHKAFTLLCSPLCRCPCSGECAESAS